MKNCFKINSSWKPGVKLNKLEQTLFHKEINKIFYKKINSDQNVDLKYLENNDLNIRAHPLMLTYLKNDRLNNDRNEELFLEKIYNEIKKDNLIRTEWVKLKNIEIPWAERALQSQQGQLIKEQNNPDLNLPLKEKPNPVNVKKLKKAAEYLEVIWPEAYEDFFNLVTHFVWFDSKKFWSSTDPTTFGAIYLKDELEWSEIEYLETIVHETGHLALSLKQTFDPLILNPLTKAYSPLRPDIRPLKGILHASFVLKRMVELHNKALNKSGPWSKYNVTIEKLLIKNTLALNDTIKTLNKHAVWSKLGKEMFNTIIRN